MSAYLTLSALLLLADLNVTTAAVTPYVVGFAIMQSMPAPPRQFLHEQARLQALQRCGDAIRVVGQLVQHPLQLREAEFRIDHRKNRFANVMHGAMRNIERFVVRIAGKSLAQSAMPVPERTLGMAGMQAFQVRSPRFSLLT